VGLEGVAAPELVDVDEERREEKRRGDTSG
jgi:hypothetical protein